MSGAADAVAAGLPAWWSTRLSATIAAGADADAIDAVLRLPGEHAPWTIYAIRLTCGAAYVGLTGQMAYYRLFNHFGGAALGDPETLSIQPKVHAGCANRCEILVIGLAEAPARERECREIADLHIVQGP